MSDIPLNKFEKRNLVIKLHKEGHTYREIAHIAHISVRDIKPIIKKYEQQKRLENNKRKENNQQPTTKKLSLSSQAFKLFKEGKKPTEVAIELDIPPRKVSKFWYQFLKLEKNLTVMSFMRNNVSGTDILNVLRTPKDVINLRAEIERLEQMKNNYLLNRNTNYLPLLPVGLPEYCYRY